MQIVVEKAALSAALARAAAFAETKGEIEVLKHCRLSAQAVGEDSSAAAEGGGELTVTAQGMVLAYRETLPCEIAKTGIGMAPAERLAKLVAGAPEGAQISLSVGEAYLSVSDGCGRYRLPLWPDDQAPREAPEGPDLTVPPGFLAGLKRVSSSISSEETRFYLNGVAIGRETNQPLLRLTSTDGHSLQSVALDLAADNLEGWPDQAAEIILPSPTVKTLGQAFEGVPQLTCRLDETAAAFEGGGRRLVSKLIAGTFPDWRRVVPQDPGRFLTCDRQDLLRALNRVALVCQASDIRGQSGHYVFLRAEGDLLIVAGAAPLDGGAGAERLACEVEDGGQGDPVEIAVNSRKLGALLSGQSETRTRIAVKGKADPITVADASDPTYRGVVMPIRSEPPAEAFELAA